MSRATAPRWTALAPWRGAVRATRCRARRHRSSSRAPAAPTRVALLALGAATPGSRRSRCTSTTACGRRARTRPTRVAALAQHARRRLPAHARGRVGTGPEPRGTRPRRAVRRRSTARGSTLGARRRARRRTPPTTRPRPCCSTCSAARRAPGSPAWRRGTGGSCDRCSRFRRAETRARAAPRSASTSLADPMNDDRAFRRVAVRHDVLPMLVGARRARPRARCSPARPTSCVQSPSTSTRSRVAAWPGADGRPARGARRAAAPRSPGARSAAGSARRRRRSPRSSGCSRSPPASARATELAGGRRVRRSGGRSSSTDG